MRRELHAPLEQALREGHLIPVCFVSARTGAGIAELLDIIVKLLPDPTEANPPDFLRGEGADARPMHARPDPSLHVLAHVFKVTVDPFIGKMGIFRVHQGTVTRDSQLYIGDGRKPFKVGHLFMLQGKDHVEVLARSCRATSRRSPRSTTSISTRCCTMPPRTTTST